MTRMTILTAGSGVPKILRASAKCPVVGYQFSRDQHVRTVHHLGRYALSPMFWGMNGLCTTLLLVFCCLNCYLYDLQHSIAVFQVMSSDW